MLGLLPIADANELATPAEEVSSPANIIVFTILESGDISTRGAAII
ncbi:hypothetical protein [Lysinibacillus sphaericus]|nr:hypothetical protein [Lysinibacillus sphaericus]